MNSNCYRTIWLSELLIIIVRLAFKTGVVARAVCTDVLSDISRDEIPKPATPIAATSATTTILRWVVRSAL